MNPHQTLLRHDQYFVALAGQGNKMQEAELQRLLLLNEHYRDDSHGDNERIPIG